MVRSAALPPLVRVRLVSKPAGAQVFRRDVRWATTPVTLDLPRGDWRLAVTLRRPGYRTARETIRMDRDSTVRVRLRPLRPHRPPPRRRSALDGFKLQQ
jgi:hypothetical protein